MLRLCHLLQRHLYVIFSLCSAVGFLFYEIYLRVSDLSECSFMLSLDFDVFEKGEHTWDVSLIQIYH